MSVAVGLVWHREHLVVGVRPAGGPLAGYDEFPGGKVEKGETPHQAVVREVREETGLAVHVTDLRLWQHEDGHKHDITFFDCALDDATVDDFPALKLPFRWVTVTEALKLRFPPANDALLETLAEAGDEEHEVE